MDDPKHIGESLQSIALLADIELRGTNAYWATACEHERNRNQIWNLDRRVRSTHERLTIPFHDGVRVLPVALYDEYVAVMDKVREERIEYRRDIVKSRQRAVDNESTCWSRDVAVVHDLTSDYRFMRWDDDVCSYVSEEYRKDILAGTLDDLILRRDRLRWLLGKILNEQSPSKNPVTLYPAYLYDAWRAFLDVQLGIWKVQGAALEEYPFRRVLQSLSKLSHNQLNHMMRTMIFGKIGLASQVAYLTLLGE